MDIQVANFVIAIASLIVAAIAGIYIPLRIYKDSRKPDKHLLQWVEDHSSGDPE